MRHKGYSQKQSAIAKNALELFLTHGYESATVDQIIAAAGISKGTFYHYFKSKRQILDHVVQGLRSKLTSGLRTISADEELGTIDKLNSFFALNRRVKQSDIPLMKMLMRALYLPENLVLRFALSRELLRSLVPTLAEIIAQGVREGIIAIDYPEETARQLLQMGMNLRDEIVENQGQEGYSLETIQRRIDAFQLTVERSLGLPPASLRLVEPGYLKAFLA